MRFIRMIALRQWPPGPKRGFGVFAADYRVRNAADGTYRWFQSRATPVRDDAGQIVEWLGTSTDIDDQVRAREVLARGQEELERLVAERTGDLARALDSLRIEAAERGQAEEALRQSQKMEAVGRLTGGIAHDFNNMLQGIAGSVEIARRRIREGRTADALRFLDTTRTAVDRAAALTHRLLAFARRQQLDPRPVDPDGLVAGMAELIRRTMGPGIRVELNLRDGAWNVLCDANELESALLNLCINARDAMPEGGRLTIGTSDAKLQPNDIAEQDGAMPGEFVAIIGDRHRRGNAAERGGARFRAVLYHQAAWPRHRAWAQPGLWLRPAVERSCPDRKRRRARAPRCGSACRVTTRAEVPVEQAPPPAPDQAQAGETVLLVDDEDGVREPACEHLRELGYKVLEARTVPRRCELSDDREPPRSAGDGCRSAERHERASGRRSRPSAVAWAAGPVHNRLCRDGTGAGDGSCSQAIRPRHVRQTGSGTIVQPRRHIRRPLTAARRASQFSLVME